MTSYQDEALLFGPEGRLLGVVTRPSRQPCAQVACLMFNFGVTHRVGPRRIQVKLARRLAEQGVASLRFDLSGLGDSQAPSGASQTFEAQTMSDVGLAIDQVEARLGIRKVIIIGLCSGAVHGLQVSVQDPRVVGLLAFDGHAFTSRAARLERRLRRFARFPAAQTRRLVDRLLGKDRTPEGDLLRTGVQARPLTAQDFRQDLETLVARGASVYLVYSASMQSRDRNKDQLHALRGQPVLKQLRYEFMPNVDHSFTEVAGQEFFLDAVCRWVEDVALRNAVAVAPPAPAPAARPRGDLSRAEALVSAC